MEDSAISPDDAGGAAALYFSHLELLARSESVASVDVALLTSEPQALRFESFKTNQPSVWRDLNRWCRSWNTIRVSQGEDGRGRYFGWHAKSSSQNRDSRTLVGLRWFSFVSLYDTSIAR